MPRKMKESGVEWLGQIPEGWGVRRNKYCYACGKEIVGSKSSDTTVLSLTTRGVKEKPAGAVGGKQPETFDTYQVVRPNDIVLCLFDLDCSAVFSGISHYDGMISPAYKVVSCKRFVCSQYAEYWFRFVSEGRKFKAYAKNLRYTLSYEEFETLPMLCPPLPEQERIAAFLDERCAKIDGMIAEAKASIEDYKKWKQSIIFEAVTGKHEKNLKPSGVDWIGDVPERWKVVPLRYLSNNYKAGPFGSALITENLLHAGRILVYTPEHVAMQATDSAKNLYLQEERAQEMEQFFVRVGEIVFPIVGSLGRAMLVTNEMPEGIINQRLAKFSLERDKIDTSFFMWLFAKSDFYKQYIEVRCRGSIIVNLTKVIVGDMPVPCPSLPEQRRIAAELDEKCAAIDKLVGEKEALIADLEAYKKSLIFETVTGKREVEKHEE